MVKISEVEEPLVEGRMLQEMKNLKTKKEVGTHKEEHMEDPSEEEETLGAGLEAWEEEIQSSVVGVITVIKLYIP